MAKKLIRFDWAMKRLLSHKTNFIILIFQVLLILAGCSFSEKELPPKAIPNAKLLRSLKDSCFKQVNIELTDLVSNSKALKKMLNLNDGEASIITNSSVDTEIPQKKGELIEKLITFINDTTDLGFYCEYHDIESTRLGDLALLCIYQVEKFPFGQALQRQWCTGGSISKNIYLPYNLIEYTNFERDSIKEAYISYYNSKDRLEYIKEMNKK